MVQMTNAMTARIAELSLANAYSRYAPMNIVPAAATRKDRAALCRLECDELTDQ